MTVSDDAAANSTDFSAAAQRVDVSHRHILTLAWPIILGNISVPLLGLVDTAILGRLSSSSSLAAVAIASQLFTLVLWTVGFLRMGTTARTAWLYGQNKQYQSIQLLFDAAIFVLPIGLLLAVLVTVTTPWAVSLFGSDPQVHEQARQYLVVRWWSIPGILAQYVVLGWAIGRGATWVPLIMLVAANLLNAVLDIWFVLFLDFGVTGLAYGSVIADYFCLVIGLIAIYLIVKRDIGINIQSLWTIRSISLRRQEVALNPDWQSINKHLLSRWWKRVRPLLVTNSHLLVRTLVLLSVFLFFTYQGAEASSAVVAANAVILTLLLLISNGLDGFAHAAETLIGQCSGKLKQASGLATLASTQRRDRWLAITRTGVQTTAVAVVMSLILVILGEQVVRWLNQQEEVLLLLDQLLPFLVLLPIVGAGGYWVDGVLLGAQQTKLMRNIMLVSAVLIFLPSWYLLTQWLVGDNVGLWISLFVFLICRLLLAIPALRRLKVG